MAEKHPDPPRSFNNWSAWRTWRRTTTRTSERHVHTYVSVAERHTVAWVQYLNLKKPRGNETNEKGSHRAHGERRRNYKQRPLIDPPGKYSCPFSPCHAYLRSVRTRQLKLIVLLVTVARRSPENIPPPSSLLSPAVVPPACFLSSSLHRGTTSSCSC